MLLPLFSAPSLLKDQFGLLDLLTTLELTLESKRLMETTQHLKLMEETHNLQPSSNLNLTLQTLLIPMMISFKQVIIYQAKVAKSVVEFMIELFQLDSMLIQMISS